MEPGSMIRLNIDYEEDEMSEWEDEINEKNDAIIPEV
jgi:hypothetical protein